MFIQVCVGSVVELIFFILRKLSHQLRQVNTWICHWKGVSQSKVIPSEHLSRWWDLLYICTIFVRIPCNDNQRPSNWWQRKRADDVPCCTDNIDRHFRCERLCPHAPRTYREIDGDLCLCYPRQHSEARLDGHVQWHFRKNCTEESTEFASETGTRDLYRAFEILMQQCYRFNTPSENLKYFSEIWIQNILRYVCYILFNWEF